MAALHSVGIFFRITQYNADHSEGLSRSCATQRRMIFFPHNASTVQLHFYAVFPPLQCIYCATSFLFILFTTDMVYLNGVL
jgi:hypothetical protein